MLLLEVFAIATGFALVVRSLATQANVLVLVKAGLMPEITAVFEASVAIPPNTLAVPPPEVLAQVVLPLVAPQNSAAGTPAVVAGRVVVVPSVPAKVRVLLAVNVFAAAIVNTPVPAVNVFPLTVVATKAPTVCVPVNVFAASVLAIVAEVVGKVRVVPSVPAKVRLLLMTAALPFATLTVPVVGVPGWVAIAFQV